MAHFTKNRKRKRKVKELISMEENKIELSNKIIRYKKKTAMPRGWLAIKRSE